MHPPTQARVMSIIEFWIWGEGTGVVLSDGELRLTLSSEGEAIEAAVRIAQELDALYRITYARNVAD
jgi:hypothetical protein